MNLKYSAELQLEVEKKKNRRMHLFIFLRFQKKLLPNITIAAVSCFCFSSAKKKIKSTVREE